MAINVKWSVSTQTAENLHSFANTAWPLKVSAPYSMKNVRRWCGVNLKTLFVRTLTQKSLNSLLYKKKCKHYFQVWSKRSKMSIWISRNGWAYLDLTKRQWTLSTWLMTKTITMWVEFTWIRSYPISSWMKKKLLKPIFQFNNATRQLKPLSNLLKESRISTWLSLKRKWCPFQQTQLLPLEWTILSDSTAKSHKSMTISDLSSQNSKSKVSTFSTEPAKIIFQL